MVLLFYLAIQIYVFFDYYWANFKIFYEFSPTNNIISGRKLRFFASFRPLIRPLFHQSTSSLFPFPLSPYLGTQFAHTYNHNFYVTQVFNGANSLFSRDFFEL
jgi:hypothetical protein